MKSENIYRIISINPDLIASESPYMELRYQSERALRNSAVNQNIEYYIVGNVNANPPLDLRESFFPSLVDTTDLSLNPSDWPKLFGARPVNDLCDSVLSALGQMPGNKCCLRRTAFYLYRGHPLHIPALIRLGLALRGACVITLNLNYLHSMYGLHRPKRLPWLKGILALTRNLRRCANVKIVVDSKRLQDLIRDDTGEIIPILQSFSSVGDEVEEVHEGLRAPVRIFCPTVLGSRERGFDLIVGLAERIGSEKIEIVAQESVDKYEVCLPTKLALMSGLKLLPPCLPLSQYKDVIRQSDLVVLPYPRWRYFTRTTGIVRDALANGIPLVGPGDTWIGDQISEMGAGTLFSDGDLHDLVRAVQLTLDRICLFKRNILAKRGPWLEQNGLS